jgi:photoactive yellow protein
MTDVSTRECARCGNPLRPEAPRSLRICADCIAEERLFPAETLLSLSETELDRLPFGVVELDRHGGVVGYNQAEEQLSRVPRAEVLGRNFFTEVAPCTNVQEFAGAYHEMVDRGVASERDLEFVFRFAHGNALVQVQLVYSAVAGAGIVLVKRRA